MLPIYVMCDHGLDLSERIAILEAISEFRSLFAERRIIDFEDVGWGVNIEGDSADWYISVARRVFRARGLYEEAVEQLDADSIIDSMEWVQSAEIKKTPQQTMAPFIQLLLTSHDLTRDDMDYCLGMTRDRYSVQSVYRYRDLPTIDNQLGIKAMIWHELGHLLGMAKDRPNGHCDKHGCIMRHSENLNDLMDYVRDSRGRGRIYCHQCMTDARHSKI
ncbi:hypothetical protein IKF88_00815 [Candidatus Saccharibacteria bacterium]|nr:hypothetical protein [Candidatus Saccharibacteria bacterium]